MSPINCWVPKELSRYQNFINNYCWVRGTYYAIQSYDDRIFSFAPSKHTLLYYYQWVPIFLLVQASLFYFPFVLWHFFVHKLLDADLFSIIEAARRLDFNLSDSSNSLTIKRYICSHFSLSHLNRSSPDFMRRLRDAAEQNRHLDANFRSLNLFSSHTNLTYLQHRLAKCYMCLAYIFIKFVYFFVTLLQIFITDYFLSRNDGSFFYGKPLLDKFLSGESELAGNSNTTTITRSFFPLLAVCDVKIKELETADFNFHLYHFSCVLASNLFNEKIFMILWLWFVLVLLPFSVYQLFVWSKQLGYRQSYHKYMYIKRRLAAFVDFRQNKRATYLMHLFSEYYVHADDMLMLRLIEDNSSLVVATDLLHELWNEFLASLE